MYNNFKYAEYVIQHIGAVIVGWISTNDNGPNYGPNMMSSRHHCRHILALTSPNNTRREFLLSFTQFLRMSLQHSWWICIFLAGPLWKPCVGRVLRSALITGIQATTLHLNGNARTSLCILKREPVNKAGYFCDVITVIDNMQSTSNMSNMNHICNMFNMVQM